MSIEPNVEFPMSNRDTECCDSLRKNFGIGYSPIDSGQAVLEIRHSSHGVRGIMQATQNSQVYKSDGPMNYRAVRLRHV
jgi:hypothetical protein